MSGRPLSGLRSFLRDSGIVARQELSDSVHSRRAAVVLILFLAGAMLACNGFISVLHRLEVQLAETLKISASSSPGAVSDALWKSKTFQQMVTSLVKNKDVALEILKVPPIALIYGLLAFGFVPPLVMLSSSSRIAEEVAGGACRFVLTRTSRLAWCSGKFVGQALILVLALALSAIGAWCIARFRLSGMQGWSAAQAMFIFAAKAWVYGLAFVGLALAVSQMTRSPNLAMALGLMTWIAVGVLYGVAHHYDGEGVRQLWGVLELLTPQGHRWDLMRGRSDTITSGAAFCVAQGLVFMLLGHAVLRRRDL